MVVLSSPGFGVAAGCYCLAYCGLACIGVEAATVKLSNLALPTDQNNQKLITGEADVLKHRDTYYLYFNNWGPCPGVDCCKTSAGCATCCFASPPTPYIAGCGNGNATGDSSSLVNTSNPYGYYHTVQVYSTKDFRAFTNLGVALPLSARKFGIEFRPHVIYNAKNKMFVMYFEDRGPGLSGYTVAQSSTPAGPFKVTHYNVTMPGKGRTGDYDIFVDEDGSAYHIRTGFDVVKLNDDYTGPDEHMSSFRTPKDSEGPVVFRRGGKYYVLSGTGCCACIGGSTIYVQMADSMKGPWTFAGDVGSRPGHKFDPHSPDNYVTKAQASAVFEVQPASGDDLQYVWMGNQWNSGLSETPPGPRMHDLLYWTVLQFETDGKIKQVQYQDEITLEL